MNMCNVEHRCCNDALIRIIQQLTDPQTLFKVLQCQTCPALIAMDDSYFIQSGSNDHVVIAILLS